METTEEATMVDDGGSTLNLPTHSAIQASDAEIGQSDGVPFTNGVLEPSPVPTSSHLEEVHLIATEPFSDVKMEEIPEDAQPAPEETLQTSRPDDTINTTKDAINQVHQVESSLVSPPDSTQHEGDETSPQPTTGVDMTPPADSISSRRSSRRRSSQHAKLPPRITPESGPARRGSMNSVAAESERASASPAAPMANGTVSGEGVTKVRRKSRVSSEMLADEESLRLIRELQAQDLGLRRRGRA